MSTSDMLFDQKSSVHREAGFPRWHTQTHRQTTDGHRNLDTELAQSGWFSETVRTYSKILVYILSMHILSSPVWEEHTISQSAENVHQSLFEGINYGISAIYNKIYTFLKILPFVVE